MCFVISCLLVVMEHVRCVIRSSSLFVGLCVLLVACVRCCWMFAICCCCCVVIDRCCLLFDVRCVLRVVCCVLLCVSCVLCLFVVCYFSSLHVMCELFHVCVVCCVLFVVWCVLVVVLFVVCCVLCGVVVCCVLVSVCWWLCVWDLDFSVDCRLFMCVVC